MDVFPVHIRINGSDIWLAWVEAPDGPAFIWNAERRIFWAHRRSALLDLLPKTGLNTDNPDNHSDIDQVLQEIRQGKLDSPKSALDIWNIFTDFSFSISEVDPGPYERAEDDLYGKLFSLSNVAEFMGIPPQNLDAAELSRLAAVLERGAQMIIDNTIRRDN